MANDLSKEDGDYLSFIVDWHESGVTFEQRVNFPNFYYEWAIERYKELASLNDEIIDFGCGDGVLTQILIKKQGVSPKSIVGIDYSKMARDEYFENTYVTPCRSLQCVNECDFVFALEVLEHTDNPEEVLLGLFNIAKKAVIFTVPIKEQIKDPQHKHTFDYDRVYNMCKKHSNNFKISKIAKGQRHGQRLQLFGVVLFKE